jgi:uncharacterized membrane protein YdjX (TVP38/TMEM64 family)
MHSLKFWATGFGMKVLKSRLSGAPYISTSGEDRNRFQTKRHHLTLRLGVLIGLLVLVIAWRWTPLSDWVEIDRSVQLIRQIGQSLGIYLSVTVIALASLFAVPVTFLAVVSILAFGPVWGSAYLLAGSTVGAVVSFSIGKWLGREVIGQIAGERVTRLDKRFEKHGILFVIALRMLPIAPFAIINMAVGISSIHLRDFVLGTILGMMPGTVVIAVFIDRFAALTRKPDPEGMILFAILVLLVGLASWSVRRWIKER